MDIKLLDQMGAEFKRRFADKPINKILTIEASGIGIACVAAQHFNVPVVFAKKSRALILMVICMLRRWNLSRINASIM